MLDAETMTNLVSNVGFPISCVIGLGWFLYQVFQKTTTQAQENMEKVQERCKEREDKLYEELAANREINRKAIDTIAHYSAKLDTIQSDISDIKTDITVIMSKQ